MQCITRLVKYEFESIAGVLVVILGVTNQRLFTPSDGYKWTDLRPKVGRREGFKHNNGRWITPEGFLNYNFYLVVTVVVLSMDTLRHNRYLRFQDNGVFLDTIILCNLRTDFITV